MKEWFLCKIAFFHRTKWGGWYFYVHFLPRYRVRIVWDTHWRTADMSRFRVEMDRKAMFHMEPSRT